MRMLKHVEWSKSNGEATLSSGDGEVTLGSGSGEMTLGKGNGEATLGQGDGDDLGNSLPQQLHHPEFTQISPSGQCDGDNGVSQILPLLEPTPVSTAGKSDGDDSVASQHLRHRASTPISTLGKSGGDDISNRLSLHLPPCSSPAISTLGNGDGDLQDSPSQHPSPRSYLYHRSHGHSHVPTALHALLSPTSPDISRRTLPSLIWDLRHPPATARPASDPRHHISSRLLSQHATSPPTPFFRITCGLFPNSWHIDLQNPHGVTVGDFLEGIFKFLRRGVDKDEYAQASHTQRVRVADAFYARAQRSCDPRYQHSHGVRRIDWLLKHTMFVGLTPSLDAPETWTLTLKRSDV